MNALVILCRSGSNIKSENNSLFILDIQMEKDNEKEIKQLIIFS